MRAVRAAVALLSLWMALPRAFADDDEPAAEPTSRPTSQSSAAPLVAGDPAPFDGVLLRPEKLETYLRLEIDLVEARSMSEAKDKALHALEQDLAKEKDRPRSGAGSFWWGFGAGVVASALLVWGGSQLVK